MSMQRSNDWITKQLLTIGSSAAGVVAGESPYQTQFELYTAMVEAEAGHITEKHLNDDMKRGILTEPLHRQLLSEYLNVKVHDHDQDVFLYSDQYHWAHALPDGWTYDLTIADEPVKIPVQLKCPRVRSWHEIKLRGIHGHWLLGSQHTLAITGAPYEHFSVLNPETMRLISLVVYRDQKLIDGLMDMEKKFYAMFMERTPPLNMADERIELPPSTGELVTIDSKEAHTAATTYFEAKAILDDAKALYELAVTRIKELMGPSRVADLPGLRAYKTAQRGRVSYDHGAMGKDGIDLEKYAKRGDDYEQFRAYSKG